MFERDKKNEMGDGVTSLIDADMRITGTVVSSGDIILAGGVEGEIKCRSRTGGQAARSLSLKRSAKRHRPEK